MDQYEEVEEVEEYENEVENVQDFNEEVEITEEYNITENIYSNQEQQFNEEFSVENNTEKLQGEIMDQKLNEEVNTNENNQEQFVIQEERPSFINVIVDFPKPATPVDCVSAATNTRDKIVASNKQLRLLQNRFYFIPVNVDPNISSDDYSNIKIYSEKAAEIDVRYIKNGMACIIALKHNTKVRQGELLAVLY
jgi:hypothetical protein